VASDTRSCAPLCYIGGENTRVAEMRGAGQKVPTIPLESTRGRGYRMPAAAAGGARDLTPASPAPQEAYSPPVEAEGPWTDTGPVGLQPLLAEFRYG